MINIITGPDNTGKTTTALKLEKDTGLPLALRYPKLPPTDGENYYNWCMNRLFMGQDIDFLMDRGIVDEFIYGPILRGYMVFDRKDQIHNVIARLQDPKLTRIIYCNPSIKVQQLTLDERPQLDGIKTQIKVINNAFDYFLFVYPLAGANVITYDFTKDGDYERLLSIIKGGQQ